MDKIMFDPRNPHIRTFTDKKFYFRDIRPQDICVEDITHSLSFVCRYGGHCNQFYSVAEHSIICSDRGSDVSMRLWGLLHDASEAYIGDICKPLKILLSIGVECNKGIECYESDILRAIASKFELPWPMPQEINTIDKELLYEETEFLWCDTPKTVLTSEEAERLFLSRFRTLRSE